MGVIRKTTACLMAAAVLSACGGAGTTVAPSESPATAGTSAPTPAPTAKPTPTSAATATPAPTSGATPANERFPDTKLAVRLSQGYASGGAAYDAAKLGNIQPGDPIAFWYAGTTTYVVVYAFLDLTKTGPLCPGSSIKTGSGFEHVSNAPTVAGACSGEEKTLAQPPVGVRMCPILANTGFAYVTAIPLEAKGTLYASLEHAQPDGSIVGLTGAIATGSTAAVDLDAMGCSPVVGP
jgi:hypothetical protein